MKDIKLLPLLSIACLPIVGFSTIGISCSNNTVKRYQQEALDEFAGNERLNIPGLASVPRPSYYHDKIIPYLKQRIMNIANIKEDKILVDNAGNMCFDIPGSEGCENSDMVILQGHTDMVLVGVPETEMTTTPIYLQTDGDLLHSIDWKTSIGADNGIGIASALTILKNRNKIVHGPIRFIFTADEDVGMVGASQLDTNWFKYNNAWIKWLINIDAEGLGEIYRSCAGNARLTYSRQYSPTAEQSLTNTFKLSIDGLTGGHSGSDIADRANADRLAYEFLFELTSNNVDVQIVSHDHKLPDSEKEDKFSSNALVSHCNLIFKTDKTLDELNPILTNLYTKWSIRYSDENWQEVKDLSKLSLISQNDFGYLSALESKEIVNLLGDSTVDPTVQPLKSLYYGVFAYQNEFNEKLAKASGNIGPVNIAEQDGKIDFSLWTSTRSTVGTYKTHEQYSVNWLLDSYKEIAKSFNPLDNAIYYPWLKNSDNPLVSIFVEEFTKLNIQAKIVDSNSGVEPSWWNQKSEGNTICTCVGPTIDNPHSANETLHISTIGPTIQTVVNALERLAKKN